MAGAIGKKWKKGSRPFIKLYRNVKRSAAYHGLSCPARAALIELIDRYTGANNGMIGLGCRELAEELNCCADTAARALRELDDSGLVHPLTPGVWRGKRATEWRLTFAVCDKSGELPTLNWRPHLSTTHRTQSPTHRTQGASQSDPPDAKAKKPNKKVLSQSDASDTYRYNQGDTELVTGTEGATPDLTAAEPLEQLSTNFGPSLQTQLPDDPRIQALARWESVSKKKPWSKPAILSWTAAG